MRALVTGGCGFVGRHLVRELAAHGYDVVAFDLTDTAPPPGAIATVPGDLRDAGTVEEVVRTARPDAVVHLGAMAFAPDAGHSAARMLEVNVCGTVNVLEAVRSHVPDCNTLVASSSHVYTFNTSVHSVTEDSPLGPVGLYGISKAAADVAACGFATQYGMPVMVARPDNHTGPGQSRRFVAPSFIAQVREIAAGQAPPEMFVGNLDCRRAFMDVRDVVRAYRLLLERGEPGNAYNVSTSRLIRIGDLLDAICGLVGVTPDVRVAPERFRPTDSAPVLDTAKLRAQTGWAPQYDLTRTLKDMLEAQ